MGKVTPAEQAKVRAEMYDAIGAAIEAKGLETETIADGLLVHLPDGENFAAIKVVYKAADKFDLDAARVAFAEKQAGAADRAAKAQKKAEEKAVKEAEKAKKAAEKAAKSE